MPKSTYANLEIRLGKTDTGRYTVQFRLNHDQRYPVDGAAYFQPALPWVATAHPEQDGARLFDQLMAESGLRTTWAEWRGQHPERRIRLVIEPSAPELLTMPWELLRDTTDNAQPLAVADSTPFSRYYDDKSQLYPPLTTKPLTMLVIIANPSDLGRFNLTAIDSETEWQLLNELVETGHALSLLKLTRLPAPCTLSAIQAALRDGSFDMVHIVAHGRYNAKKQLAALMLENEQQLAQAVTEQEFAAMVAQQSNRPRLIFLASCQTAMGDEQSAFRGFAPALFREGRIPAVLAMQDFVAVATAREFSRIFYAQLLTHGQVDLACNQARASIITANIGGSAIPVLFSRLQDNHLFEVKRDYAAIGLRRRLDRQAEWAWTDALLECGIIKNSPDEVRNELRPEMAHNIRQNAAARVYIKNMVNTCAGYPGGLEELLDVIQNFEGDSEAMLHLRQIAQSTVPDLQMS